MPVDLTLNITAIEPPPNGGHNVTLEYDGSNTYGKFSLSMVSEAITRLNTELRKPEPALPTLEDAGAMLFDELLGGSLFRSYTRAVTQAESREQSVRLRINSALPALIGVPWEYLYDSDSGHWPALHRNLSLVRGLPLSQHAPKKVDGLLRVLVMISDPTDLPRLDHSRELANLQSVEAIGAIELIRVDPTYDALQRGLRQGPNIFHFVGHGTFPGSDYEYLPDSRQLRIHGAARAEPKAWQGMLAFCKEDGKADLVEAERLAPLLAGCRTLGLVFLNACEGASTGGQSAFAGLTQRLIREEIPAVLAMQAPIIDSHALRFGREFYAALADGRNAEEAVTEGRLSIRGEAETWGIPTFYLCAARPFEINPLSMNERADWLWQESLKRTEPSARRQLLEGALKLVPNHAGACAGLERIDNEEQVPALYAEALRHYQQAAWRECHQVLQKVEQYIPNYKETRSLLAEVLDKLGPTLPLSHRADTDENEQYRPILNALLEGRLNTLSG